MSDDQACCAHKRVHHGTVPAREGTVRDIWLCDDCQTVFYPEGVMIREAAARIADLEAELSSAIDFRVSRERELGGVIADQDRKVELLAEALRVIERMIRPRLAVTRDPKLTFVGLAHESARATLAKLEENTEE